MSLSVVGARVEYRRRRRSTVRALDDVDLAAADGELVAVVGRSGSGKSTLLRSVAGLVTLAAGTVSIDGRRVDEEPPGARSVALVPQDLPLFPHLDVAANIAFGEVARRTPAAERATKIADAVEVLGLGRLLDRRPDSLSGGERQRVALARALVRRPAVFLLDEPLSGLDGATRLALRADIRRLQRETATTMLYVTHDPQEAMAVADRVAVLADGRIEQTGPPGELYARPRTTVVARLVGPLPMNLLPGAVAGTDPQVTVGVRPERLRLVEAGSGRLDATVVAVELIGEQSLVRLLAADVEVLVVLTDPPAVGATHALSWAPADEHRFGPSGTRLDTAPGVAGRP